MSEPSPTPADSAQVWRADGTVEADWAAPASVPPGPPSRSRRKWVWLAPLLAVIVLVAVVVSLGGLGKRHDTLQTVAVGATISTGTFDYTFTKATAQAQDDLGKPIYKVTVYGTAQNTTDAGRAPSEDQFAGRDVVDPDAQDASGLEVGSSTGFAMGRSLNPGLAPAAFQVEFDFPQTWRPSGTFRIAASAMVEEQYFLNQKQANWQNDDTGFQVYVPMQTLAPKESRPRR